MEELESQWGCLTLTQEENTIIDLEGEGIEETQMIGDHNLIGKLCMDRSIAKETIATTMAKIWKISKPASSQECGSNMVVIMFATHVDKEKVLAGRPWLFDNYLFVLM